VPEVGRPDDDVVAQDALEASQDRRPRHEVTHERRVEVPGVDAPRRVRPRSREHFPVDERTDLRHLRHRTGGERSDVALLVEVDALRGAEGVVGHRIWRTLSLNRVDDVHRGIAAGTYSSSCLRRLSRARRAPTSRSWTAAPDCAHIAAAAPADSPSTEN